MRKTFRFVFRRFKMTKNILLAPILKWVGGKRQLLNDILPLIQSKGTYIEPFLVGVLFYSLINLRKLS